MCIITQHRFVFKDTAGAACPEDKRFNIKLEREVSAFSFFNVRFI